MKITLNKVFVISVLALALSIYALVYPGVSDNPKTVTEEEKVVEEKISPSIALMSSVGDIYCADDYDDEEYYGGSGSVWTIDGESFWIITNEHVLEGAYVCYVYFTLDWLAVLEDYDKAFEDGYILEYEVDLDNKQVSSIAGDDLAWALLKEGDDSLESLDGLVITPGIEGCKDFYPIGTQIKIFGYPETGSYDGVITVTEGIISSFEREEDVYYYLTSAKLDYGNSGGLALVDVDKDTSCLVGIPSAIIEGEAESLGRILVVPESRIKKILDNPYNN